VRDRTRRLDAAGNGLLGLDYGRIRCEIQYAALHWVVGLPDSVSGGTRLSPGRCDDVKNLARSPSYHPRMSSPSRLRRLNEHPVAADGRYVLYWMQASQRTRWNPALEYAIEQANELSKPLIVAFGLMDDYPEANARHYSFMLDGLRDVAEELGRREIKFIVRHGSPPQVAASLAKEAALLVCDRGYARHQKAWRDHVADHCNCRVDEVEGDVVVPVEVASVKQEFGARTIRPRLHRQWETYFVPMKHHAVKHSSLRMRITGDLDVTDPQKLLGHLKLDRSVPVSTMFRGGQIEATKRLKSFVNHKLDGYDEGRNEPAAGHTSMLGAYLHFGQLSPLEAVLAVREAKGIDAADRDAFIEQVAVRRELAMNFVQYSPHYDSYDGLPPWAKKTLSEHRLDKREHIYSRQQLEAADTADPYWNAAQREMNITGFMHNYMRMYWGKKVLEWSASPQEAYDTLLYLNNKLFLCGRDPNGYANVGWIFGLHDRAWGPVRPIFGKIRYMNAAGLKRKFDMDAYIKKVEAL
jgi:deoxyribodipyrimidine photo-lyase